MKWLVGIYEFKSSKIFESFFSRFISENLSVQDRRLIKKIILIQIKLSLTTTIKMGRLGLFGSNLFQIFNCIFVQTFCDFVDYRWLVLENSSFKN